MKWNFSPKSLSRLAPVDPKLNKTLILKKWHFSGCGVNFARLSPIHIQILIAVLFYFQIIVVAVSEYVGRNIKDICPVANVQLML